MKVLENAAIAVVGAGNIGRALIGGLLKGHDLKADQIRASRRTQESLDELAHQFPGIRTSIANTDAVAGADIVILAIKPQMASGVINEIKGSLQNHTLIVSVLAGVTTATLQERFGRNLPVVRTMPNTPALVDEGATAICAGAFATPEDTLKARAIFEAVGPCGSRAGVPDGRRNRPLGQRAGVYLYGDRGADGRRRETGPPPPDRGPPVGSNGVRRRQAGHRNRKTPRHPPR